MKNILSEKIYKVKEHIPEQLVCQECGKEFIHLGSHIAQGHKMLAKDYKSKYGLPYKMPLIAESVRIKKQKAWDRTKDIAMANLTTEHSFKKGQTGQRRISEHERKVILERINDVNKNRVSEMCIVCNMIFDNVDSHLAAKHKLLRIKMK